MPVISDVRHVTIVYDPETLSFIPWDGSISIGSQHATTATVTSVNDTASSTTLLAANTDRVWASIQNDSTEILYVKLGTTASATSYTVRMVANAYYEVPLGYVGRHPKYLEHLEGFNVKLWHVFDATEDGRRVLPPGDWAVTGGCDVGMRAMTLSAFLGFRDLHLFGMDGCASGPDAARHAADHPHGKQKYQTCEYEGVTYHTTSAMLEAARQVFHELDQLPKVTATFHGDGLIQEMAKRYTPNPIAKPLEDVVAFQKPELISSQYAELNAQLHRDNLGYGVGGAKHADVVKKLKAATKAESVLDYGSGKGYLAKALDFPIWQYDPAIPEFSESPRPADLVICTDVLEHVEPDRLDFVLADLRRCVKQVGYFVIHTGPANKTLADGRNAHLIQQPLEWWKQRLSVFFNVGSIQAKGLLLHVVVSPKPKKKVSA